MSVHGTDTYGIVNTGNNVPSSSREVSQGSHPTLAARTSGCFDGITRQELGI